MVRPREKASTVASYDAAPKRIVSLWDEGRLAVRNPRLLNVSTLAKQSRMGQVNADREFGSLCVRADAGGVRPHLRCDCIWSQMVRPPVTFATHRLLKFFEHGSFNTNQHRLRHHICR